MIVTLGVEPVEVARALASGHADAGIVDGLHDAGAGKVLDDLLDQAVFLLARVMTASDGFGRGPDDGAFDLPCRLPNRADGIFPCQKVRIKCRQTPHESEEMVSLLCRGKDAHNV